MFKKLEIIQGGSRRKYLDILLEVTILKIGSERMFWEGGGFLTSHFIEVETTNSEISWNFNVKAF